MRIAEVAPLDEAVPPRLYGGTERVVHYLTEELVRKGHDVTLFASADSKTTARHIPYPRGALRLDQSCKDKLPHYIAFLDMIASHARQFDVIHFHIDLLHFPLCKRLNLPSLTTLHGRLDSPDLPILYRQFPHEPLISISDSQRKPLPFANWLDTIYHGLPPHLYEFNPNPKNYLAFLGRFSPEKRPDRAIAIAKKAGIKLKMAAKVDPADKVYFETKIKPLLDHPLIESIGEIGESQKSEFLGNALALLFPIDWPEPFGLVMIESLACGTPVIAFNGGSTSEVLASPHAGRVVNNIEEAVACVKEISKFDRVQCRQYFEKRFSVATMTDNYIRIFKEIADVRSVSGRANSNRGAVLRSSHVSVN